MARPEAAHGLWEVQTLLFGSSRSDHPGHLRLGIGDGRDHFRVEGFAGDDFGRHVASCTPRYSMG